MTGSAFFALSGGGPPFSVEIPPGVFVTAPEANIFAYVQSSVSGGIGPFDYFWQMVADPGVSIASNGNSQGAFLSSNMNVTESRGAQVFVTVTDNATGASVNSNSCSITFVRF